MLYDHLDIREKDANVVGVNTDVTADWLGEEVTLTFSGRVVHSDYGVPGSPLLEGIEDVEIDRLLIMDIEVDPRVLPKALQDKLLAQSYDVDWEQN